MADTTPAPGAEQDPTVFDAIGGAPAVEAVVDLFYDKVLADPELAGWFEGRDMERLKRHQRLFVGQALGAREPYPGRTMERAHQGLAITGAAFDLVVGHLAAALAEAGVDAPTIGTVAAALLPLKDAVVTA
ncbi:group I truncated hemoglobin [Streptomyces sp. NRRL F-5123]|uniref:group I truncated hemoglobin n=1 Tax=Streptomyces sp. NRRL F-5123 TaxID=1463856 RepID=UPI000693E0ED|nr:group 1 truncated hemoglobin [Streptomyces sp. NRRL F-5123]